LTLVRGIILQLRSSDVDKTLDSGLPNARMDWHLPDRATTNERTPAANRWRFTQQSGVHTVLCMMNLRKGDVITVARQAPSVAVRQNATVVSKSAREGHSCGCLGTRLSRRTWPKTGTIPATPGTKAKGQWFLLVSLQVNKSLMTRLLGVIVEEEGKQDPNKCLG
jgi:hypothetical protein